MQLSSEDLTVWLLALSQQPHLASGAQYQVLLSPDTVPCEDDAHEYPAWWRRSCSLRADVVHVTAEKILVIEVKPRGGLSAIGQAAGYAYLYRKTKQPTLPVEAWVVCHAAVPHCREFSASIGVSLLEVGWPDNEAAVAVPLTL